MIVMRGRAKGETERLVALAHQTEVMARQKVLRPLKHYLEPEKKPSVLAMMKRIKAKQDKENAR